MQLTPDQEQLWQIFHPYAAAQQARILSQGTRFVHYTRAEAAMNILRKRQVWMRKSTCMNDFMEVRHGLNCLLKTYSSAAGDRFKLTLDNLFPGLRPEIEKLFDDWTQHILLDTYFTSVSEHKDEEDKIGRLSMWRAYGDTSGVALVMNSAVFIAPSDVLKAYASPVAYLSDEAFATEFAKIGEKMACAADFLESQGREVVKNYVFNVFMFGVVCTKHPGFAEELEWRVFYSPRMYPSKHLIRAIEVVQGTPQPVYKIPLNDVPEEGFVGAQIPALLERIIIGPTKYTQATCEAFWDLLAEAGVVDPQKKIVMSDIPLRR